MTSTILAASVTFVILSLTSSWWGASAAPPSGRLGPVMMGTTSTESPSSYVLDDPANSATTSENTDTPASEEVCFRCFEKVQFAKDNLEVYDNILRKQKKLINRKKAAAEAAEAAASQQPEGRPPVRSNKTVRLSSSSASHVNEQNSSVRSRTLQAFEPIVVSRLRVARSAAESSSSSLHGRPLSAPSNKDKFGLNKKDVELERLKRDQQKQKDKTCKSLLELHECLDAWTHECIGNLQFHMYEVFAEQIFGKLRCPYTNNPDIHPFAPRMFQRDEEVKVPQPRRFSSPEAVRERLQEILPGRQFPLGVMLRPTAAPSVVQQQQQQQVQPSGGEQQPGSAYQQLMRGLSGQDYQQHAQSQIEPNDDSVNMVNVGKILLVPCCFAIMVALLALASLHYKAPKDGDEDQDEEDAQPERQAAQKY